MNEKTGLINNKGIHERLRSNTHRVLGTFLALGYISAAGSIFALGSRSTGTIIYIAGCAAGLLTSLCVVGAEEHRPRYTTSPECDLSSSLLKSMVIPPFLKGGDPRRFLAFTNFAVHTAIYVGHAIVEPQISGVESILFALSFLCNTALALPQKNETAYILYGIPFCAINLGLLLANSLTHPATSESIFLATTNALSLGIGLFVTGVNAYSHKEAIKTSENVCGKIRAFFAGYDGPSEAQGILAAKA